MVKSLLKQHLFSSSCVVNILLRTSTKNISLKRSFKKILLQIEFQNIISSRYIISGAKRLEVIRAWGALAFRGSALV